MNEDLFREFEDLLPDVTLEDAKRRILECVDRCFEKMAGDSRCDPCDHPELIECKYNAIGREKVVMGAMIAICNILEVMTFQLCHRVGKLPNVASEAIARVMEASFACTNAIEALKAGRAGGEEPNIPDILKEILGTLKSKLPGDIGVHIIPIGFDKTDIEHLRSLIEQIKSGNIEASQLPDDLDIESLNAMLKKAEEEES